jgi:hypothetical protein
MSARINLNGAVTMRCRELNRLDSVRRMSFCNGELSGIINAASECPGVCAGVCTCEGNGEELDSRFILEYNMTDDLGMNLTMGSEDISCNYVHDLDNKEEMCQYPHVKRTCTVSILTVTFVTMLPTSSY